MKLIIGLIIVFGCVLSGFIMAGGQPLALWHLNEVIIIGGAAGGAFVIANPGPVLKDVLGGLPGLLKGSPYKQKHYMDLLALLNGLFQKARKEGLMGIEADIEEPEQSPIFSSYPDILKDHLAIDFICDYMRLIVSGNMNPFELDALMSQELDKTHEENMEASHAVEKVSDALPGFGIVAAVLGIVITMGSLNEGPDVIGGKVAAALVGTFLGILFAYGVVGPMAAVYATIAQAKSDYLGTIRAALIANVQGYTPQISVEFGRKCIPHHMRPSFSELEEFLREQGK